MKSLILAIESSCDDSSIAIIDKNTYECKFHKKISQENAHSVYGGVVPELAARLHSEALPKILEKCQKYFDKLCAIAVTNEPGLSVSLIGGVAMAKMLAISLNLPLIAINHLKGHIYSMFLDKKARFDMGVLLVSGGHTMVLFIDEQGKITELVRTNDDSFGESFDKVAKMMDLGYPGGAIIENLAKNTKESNLEFSIPLLHSKDLAYSFSGLKNQVRLEILKEELSLERKSKIAFAFQKAAIAHILNKLEKIFKEYKFKRFGIVGGASANLSLRSQIEHLCQNYQCELLLAPLEYCSDNALMIARAACEAYERKEFVSIEDDLISPKVKKLQGVL
ncbi:N6-L-threonylcarbamoyladenine synthase, TsaD subunit [Campylobacter subantarcticus LMG 24377]|uniref:tRNA N6-adenosine threonylcarbamoyltransferase n=2 Tax=Campylobacter subantarcticus TaxID=497724 RepID=A0A0A8HF79_9BACT|nr:tRNA (adenosine(37)-N6)-threonylcarbamoyltransferase complex transferase subunit TsaD [Campylobacter subantarcticus]EAJ1261901.1 tRNA (adenosine(37)-N6)-threonylcarbamoyltransferase complex transferase subunit TsaD [Campylobacter lari]AJC91544.1 N6-L-threonylcarbamoyladenine synthase, TsaD subunit [Campylobacter subantarcticus LMG 24374]AJC93317.1 N6-L-threonylcarbamoyladenine synthase, TsaD subunit [Campylobacter subantarcticus LMG 24377]EAL3939728.1 tRNA (adenosine(37)-N6)-threonylcarbamoy